MDAAPEQAGPGPVASADDRFIGNSRPYLTIEQVIDVCRRRGPAISAIGALAATLVFLLGLSIPPKYTATAQMIVSDEAGAGRSEALNALQVDQRVDTHLTRIRSAAHLARVIDDLRRDVGEPPRENLVESVARPPSHETKASGADESQQSFGATLLHRLAIWTDDFHFRAHGYVPSLKAFENNLRVQQERRSRIISVSYTSTSAVKAAEFANKVAVDYIDYLSVSRRDMYRKKLAALDALIASERPDPTGAAAPHGSADAVGDYANALSRRDELRRNQRNSTAEVSIAALSLVPSKPSSLNPLVLIVPTFLMSVVIGLWLAMISERIDPRLRSEMEASAALGIPCIGLLPRLSADVRNAADYQRREPFAPYSDAIRSIAATLSLIGPSRHPSTILISSSLPQEGRTTLAESLAACVAMAGRRTVLVDASIPHLRGEAGAEETEPLVKVENLPSIGADCVRLRNLDVDPLALFADGRIGALMEWLRERYDFIIVDGPPALGHSEAKFLLPHIDRLVFAVKWGSTRRDIARNGLRALFDPQRVETGPEDEPVAVLTQVDVEAHARCKLGDSIEAAVSSRRIAASAAGQV